MGWTRSHARSHGACSLSVGSRSSTRSQNVVACLTALIPAIAYMAITFLPTFVFIGTTTSNAYNDAELIHLPLLVLYEGTFWCRNIVMMASLSSTTPRRLLTIVAVGAVGNIFLFLSIFIVQDRDARVALTYIGIVTVALCIFLAVLMIQEHRSIREAGTWTSTTSPVTMMKVGLVAHYVVTLVVRMVLRAYAYEDSPETFKNQSTRFIVDLFFQLVIDSNFQRGVTAAASRASTGLALEAKRRAVVARLRFVGHEVRTARNVRDRQLEGKGSVGRR